MTARFLHRFGILRWDSLDTREGLVLRGAGILLIMLHNFTHWVPPVTGENEFGFEARHFTTMLEQLADTPIDAWRILFSYFGHYGVQVFVFLSAYGLTRSFAMSVPDYRGFLWKRIRALYPAVIIAACTFLIYNRIVGSDTNVGDTVLPLLRQFFLIGNFTGDGFTPIGPWWFLSMICQFYLIFPFLFRGLRRFGTPFLVFAGGAAILSELTLNESITATTEINLNYTVVGHLAEFSLGMWAAGTGRMIAPRIWIVAAVGMFTMGQLHPTAWLLSGLAFLLFSIPALRWIAALSPTVTSIFAFYGNLSLPLFLINGFLRNPLVWLAQRQVQNGASHVWLTTILWSLAFLVSCTLFAWAAARLEHALRTRYRD